MVSIREKAYAAGIVDGEGCLTITRQKQGKYGHCYHVYVSISNTKPQLMQFMHRVFGGRVHKKKRSNGKFRPLYVWFPKGKGEARKFLGHILPFLTIKRVQARRLLDFLQIKGCNVRLRNAHYRRLKYLNKRGVY